MKKNNNPSRTKTINVNYIARVEGEGALYVDIKDEKVVDVKLKIFEPPRFFEALLRGRNFREAPDITARICGICPVAYQMSAVHAMEEALGIVVEGELGALRRLLYCGEWIESHGLHICMLHAPDFLGFPDVVAMAKAHPREVERALRIKKAGNSLVALLGGREIHPINVRVGGFYKVPEKMELQKIVEELKWGRNAAIETAHWVAGFHFPDFERDYEFVALSHPELYPLDAGRIKSNRGLDITAKEYDTHFEEYQVPHSTALQCRLKERGSYMAGPMARFALNYAALTPLVKEVARDLGMTPPCCNPYKSIIIRSLEVLYAFDEALRLIEGYEKPKAPALLAAPRKGTGSACTEAPRGLLYHKYELDEEGTILSASIVPPTSQNQKTIEEDLQILLQQDCTLPEAELAARCERIIRNYDPCISCAAHFLTLKINK